MTAVFDSVLAGLPHFLLQSATAFAVLITGILIYLKLTPHQELALIRAGNSAAAVSLAAAIVGLAIPIAFCLSGSVSALDVAVWGSITLIFQLAAFRLSDVIIRDLPKRIEAGEMGAATLLSAIKLATASINAAAVSV